MSKTFKVYTLIRDNGQARNVTTRGFAPSMLAEIAYERNLFSEALFYSEIGAEVGYDSKISCVFIPSMLVRIRIMIANRSAEGFHNEWKRLEEGMRHIGADAQWQGLIAAFHMREALRKGTSGGGTAAEWLSYVNGSGESICASVGNGHFTG